MSNSVKRFDGDFYDADYYERGQTSGKGWLMDYKWMPQRSFREALGYIDFLELDGNSRVLDVGCAKGFIVRALNELYIDTCGCDISEYALKFAGEKCFDCSDSEFWDMVNPFTHAIAKDVFEHMTKEQLPEILANIAKVTKTLMCIMPMGDNGKYRIPEYHMEISHLIIENEFWWAKAFKENGWNVIKSVPHVKGLKDNWQSHADGRGNHVFVLEKN